jgi:hydroxymethylbilane synthase
VKTIILGARGSQLALAQAELAKQAVERLPGRPEAIIRITTTTGDRRLDINLSQPGGAKIDKGLFTKELEEALLSGEIDVAVHSLKDLPTELQPELELAATLPRHDPVDVLISKTANSLRKIPLSGIVATSSPRRARQCKPCNRLRSGEAYWVLSQLALCRPLLVSLTLRRQLSTHQVVTVRIPAADGRIPCIRRDTHPEPIH